MNAELTALRREQSEVVDLLNKERMTTKKLKQEAVIASSEMIKMQREHLSEVTRIQSVLTDEQKAEIVPPKPTTPPPRSASTFAHSTSSVSTTSEISSSTPDSSPEHNSQKSDDSNMARIVSNVEWEEMQKELAKVSLSWKPVYCDF